MSLCDSNQFSEASETYLIMQWLPSAHIVLITHCVDYTVWALGSIQWISSNIYKNFIKICLNSRVINPAGSILNFIAFEKMYRQVLVSLSQRNFQCILWRQSPTAPLSTYSRTTFRLKIVMIIRSVINNRAQTKWRRRMSSYFLVHHVPSHWWWAQIF